MRRTLLLCLALAFAVPATAFALVPLTSSDGTLAVRAGDGKVQLKLRSGVILGLVDSGRLEVVDPDVDCEDLNVWNSGDPDLKFVPRPGIRQAPSSPRRVPVCVFKADDQNPMRFRLIGEGDVTVVGSGIWMSVVGRGRAYLLGRPTKAHDGRYSLNGDVFKSLPDDGDWVDVRGS
jgi:hypothetical protein